VALEAELEALRTRAVAAEQTSANPAGDLAAESADMEAWKALSQAQAEKLAVAASKIWKLEAAAADAEKAPILEAPIREAPIRELRPFASSAESWGFLQKENQLRR